MIIFKLMKKLITFIYTFFVTLNFAQDCDKVLYTGSVQDTLRPQGFYNLMVINKSTGQGVFGAPDGSFSVYAKQGDTIVLSTKGYPLIVIDSLPDNDCQVYHTYYLEPKTQEIAEVVVKPLKSLNQLKEERQNLAMRETRQVTGLEVMQSPITALYQAFSKKEKTKRWIAEQEHLDNQRDIIKELLRNYVAYDIIELTEEEFDEFISFLNMDETFLKTATEMELITFIKDKYEHYKTI